MKYFAKWLPTEGEIKKGESYTTESIIVKESVADWTIANMGAMDAKKVVLFLCSRDIQVGDDVRLGEGGNTYTYPSTQIDVNYWRGLGGFKVIGPISPGAVWVKEGDEFEEGEWKFRWFKPDLYGRLIASNHDYHPSDEALSMFENYTKMIKIKCSKCEAFH